MLMMWFNLILGSISIVLTTIPPQQRKRKLELRIKLCHNIKLCSPRYFCSSSKALFPSFKITGVTTLAVRGDCSRGNRVGRRVGIYWRMDLGFEVIATSSNNPTWTTSVCSCERNHTMNRTVHILVLSTFQPSLFPTPWIAFTLPYNLSYNPLLFPVNKLFVMVEYFRRVPLSLDKGGILYWLFRGHQWRSIQAQLLYNSTDASALF